MSSLRWVYCQRSGIGEGELNGLRQNSGLTISSGPFAPPFIAVGKSPLLPRMAIVHSADDFTTMWGKRGVEPSKPSQGVSWSQGLALFLELCWASSTVPEDGSEDRGIAG